LPALQVRHDDDVHDAEDYACGEQDEFDGHTRQYTLSRVDVSCGFIRDRVEPAASSAMSAMPPKAESKFRALAASDRALRTEVIFE
jgi:hypothetical protein